MTRRSTTGGAVLAAVLLALPGAARAEAGDCTGSGDLKDHPSLSIGRVTGAPRTFFVKDASDAKGCPAASEACRAKSFLVPGDRVIMGAANGAFTCVEYIGPKGADRAGWLPTAGIAREEPGAVAREDWLGTWVQTESRITIKAGPAGRLLVQGDATFGALDPDRVKRGNVNVGEIKGEVAPQGPDLAFVMGDDGKTLPVDKGDDMACKVWMRRLGPYLIVDDDNNCGGMNVSFRGAYSRGR